jgi:hypothetical protein
MGQLSEAVSSKIAGPAWSGIRDKFLRISDCLLRVSPEAKAQLTTIYVKYAITGDPLSPVYGVIWIDNSKRLLVGLALPPGADDPELLPAPPRRKYKGLTKYFFVTAEHDMPSRVEQWAKESYEHVVAFKNSL